MCSGTEGAFVEIQSRSALHCTALHCTALHCTALHCTALLLRISSGIFCISHLAFAAAVSVNGVAAWSEIGIALCRSFGFL
ncbi:hypothetical protein B375_0203645 [Xylella fastidiosa 6c]|nr:hypothetical protein B375_0203645 [Xylella fastidiosa 6c]